MGRNNIINIPSETRHIREVSSKILEAVSHCHLDEDALFDIRLSIEEAVRNAITHGNRSSKDRRVKISYSIEPDRLVVAVEDEGRGYDREALPDPTSDENILKGGGRGVYIIKKLMDKVEFNTAGNRIEMTKFFKKER